MRPLLVLKNLFRRFGSYVLAEARRAELSRANPSCRLYAGVQVDRNSTLGRFNVLFEGASLLDSTIGDHSYLQKNSTAMSCDIGKFCSIAANAFIGLPQHEVGAVSSHPVFYLQDTPLVRKFCKSNRGQPIRRTVVGHDVWIGHGAQVMSGVSIGTGAIIGAGSVVTKDVPEYAIVAGVPARIIRYRFDDVLKERLIESRWWEMSEEWLEENVDLFASPSALLAELDRRRLHRER